MRLWLSSYRIGNHPEALVELLGDTNIKAAVIPNAGDSYGRGPIWDEKLEREINSLNALGMQAEALDLLEYFGKPDALAEKLKEYGFVWVKGGNTFVLRKAMKESGFDEAILPLLQADAIVYGGYSAGAIAATPTLRGSEVVDQPENTPDGYPEELQWDGLGLVDYAIAPHYRSDHPESEDVEKMVEFLEQNGISYKTLRDGEVIVVNHEVETLLQ